MADSEAYVADVLNYAAYLRAIVPADWYGRAEEFGQSEGIYLEYRVPSSLLRSAGRFEQRLQVAIDAAALLVDTLGDEPTESDTRELLTERAVNLEILYLAIGSRTGKGRLTAAGEAGARGLALVASILALGFAIGGHTDAFEIPHDTVEVIVDVGELTLLVTALGGRQDQSHPSPPPLSTTAPAGSDPDAIEFILHGSAHPPEIPPPPDELNREILGLRSLAEELKNTAAQLTNTEAENRRKIQDLQLQVRAQRQTIIKLRAATKPKPKF